MSVVDENLSDFSEIIQEYYDEPDVELKELKAAFTGMHGFFSKENETDSKGKDKEPDNKILYQYRTTHQGEFEGFQHVISEKLHTVYPVVKDINESFTFINKEPEPKTPQQSPSQQINIAPAQLPPPPPKLSWFQRIKGDQLPKGLEDAHLMTKEWQISNMNVPNLYQKWLDYHYKGVIRADLFEEGMESYLQIEIWYMGTILEPQITRMVKRGLELHKLKAIVTIKEAYGNSLQTHQVEEQAKLFGGGGSD